jgi:cell filamentation protein
MPGYTLPDGMTVKNKLGAISHAELEKLEGRYVRERLYQIEIGSGPSGAFDAILLKATHRRLFQDVYEWAGHTRDERISLSDGTTATEPVLSKFGGRPFMAGNQIAGALDNLGAKLRDANYLRGLSRAQFAERAADIIVDLNAIHAFREGNGRTQRVFVEQLAQAAGHDLDFTVVTRERM